MLLQIISVKAVGLSVEEAVWILLFFFWETLSSFKGINQMFLSLEFDSQ